MENTLGESRSDISSGPLSYPPLGDEDIRLFSFAGNDPTGDLISLEMQNVPSVEPLRPPFVAISYVCGDLEDLVPITVNGSTHKIYRTLRRALQDLRAVVGQQLAWADAVCINQLDLADKEKQVARIGDIYRAAHRVLVYSGPADASSDLLAEAFPDLLKKIASAVADGPPYPLTHQFFEKHQLPLPTEVIWGALRDFYARSWGERLWIVQEIALSQAVSIYCGEKSFEWNNLLTFEEGLRQLELFTHLPRKHDGTSVRWQMMKELEGYRDGTFQGFLTILAMAGMRDCFNPLDRIYALRCMMEQAIREQIPVSYSPEIQENYHLLYLRVGHVALSVHDDLTPLTQVWTQQRLPELPSWCPNWHSRQDYVGMTERDSDAGGRRQTHEVGPHIASSIDRRQIYLRGVKVSEVEAVVQSRYELVGVGISRWYESDVPVVNKTWLRECLSILNDPSSPSERDSLFRALVFGNIIDPRWERIPADQLNIIFTVLFDFLDFANARYKSDDTPGSAGFEGLSRRNIVELLQREHYETYPLVLRALDERMAGCNDERRIFRTSTAQIGNAHHSVQPGDKICVFSGCPYPLILRQSVKAGEYTLVSNAWVSGLMKGEAWDYGFQEEIFIVN